MAKATVGVRDLRNHGSDVLARVQAGEHLIVTKSGRPVAELTPLDRAALTRQELINRWKHVPKVNFEAFRQDLDALVDDTL